MEGNSDEVRVNLSSSASHHRVQKSTTLNRRYVKKPEVANVAAAESAAIDSVAKRRADDLKRRQALADKINRERLAAMKAGRPAPAVVVPTPAPVVQAPAPKPLAATIEKNLVAAPKAEKPATIKDSALTAALKNVDTVDEETSGAITSSISAKATFGPKKIALALACAAIAVGTIGYVVSQSTPDLSVRVAAMQSGIDASYPSYVPRGYSLSDIVSSDGKLEMTFSNTDGTNFVLTEEKSAWDNEALEQNYAEATWGNNYTSVREQGITIFIAGSDAAWTNGGIVYKINASGNNLTKKQIKSIAVSL